MEQFQKALDRHFNPPTEHRRVQFVNEGNDDRCCQDDKENVAK